MAEQIGPFGPVKGLRRHYDADLSTRTRNAFPDHISSGGLPAVCGMEPIDQVGLKAKMGRALYPEPYGLAVFAAEKRLPDLSDLQILPQLIGEEVEWPRVNTECGIGGFQCMAPLIVSSYGSTRAVAPRLEAITVAAARQGIPFVVGESMFATFGEDGLRRAIAAYLNAFTGKGAVVVQANPNDIRAGVLELAKKYNAHAVEIKLAQGAMPGLGASVKFEGRELAEHYKRLGYTVLDQPDGTFERHAKPGGVDLQELTARFDEYADFGLPLWIKLAYGKGLPEIMTVLNKIKAVKCVTIDGFAGATGHAPLEIMNEVGLPSAAALAEIPRCKFSVVVSGGIATGIDVAKAMMLGADGAGMGRAFLIAASLGDAGVENFIKAVREEMQMVAATQRIKSLKELKGRKSNLAALDERAGRMFGVQ